jgi:multidrug resistance efflux pump
MRRVRHVAVAVAAAVAVLAGCATPSGLVVAGTVDDTLSTVVVPALTVPAVNLDAGFTDSTGEYDPATGRTSDRLSSAGTTYSVGTTVRIASVAVAEGDTVHAGQTIATVDTAALKAQLAVTRADAAEAAATVDVLASGIDETYDKQADVKDAKRKVRDAIDRLHDAKAKLLTARKTIQQALPKLKAALAQVRTMIATYPPVPPPGFPTLDELRAQERKLAAQVSQLAAGLKKINRTLPQLNTGLKKAKQGLRKLEDAEATITDARGTLRDLKELAELRAEAMKVPIDVVRAQVSLATLTSPVDGVVVRVAAVGDELAPGAGVADVRESGPRTVTAWLSPAQLDRVCEGDAASISGDWTDTATPATLTRIGTRADYPPTSVPTDEVHLTRAVEVAFTATGELPAGVPVEITIQGCREAADSNQPNR